MLADPPVADASRAAALYRARFGASPTVIASAPGRVNLVGEHTDYNGGEVLPMAIARRTWVAVGALPAGTSHSRAVSASSGEAGEWDAAAPRRSGRWWDYVSGVAAALADRGIALPPVAVAVASDVPAGAGLSSSAALEVATATALARLAGAALPPAEAALLGQRVEAEFVGVACGIMDQFASALGRPGEALHLWCDTARYEQVAMQDAVLIFDTAVPRSLRGSAFNTRREECEAALRLLRRDHPGLPSLAAATPEQVAAAALPPPLDRRARHVTEETRRVGEVVAALRATGTLPGPLLYQSHESLRSLYECSSPELDWFVERAAGLPGVTGARLTGAGWGGCAIAAGEEAALVAAAAALAPEYQARFGIAPRSWITRASGGVSLDGVND